MSTSCHPAWPRAVNGQQMKYLLPLYGQGGTPANTPPPFPPRATPPKPLVGSAPASPSFSALSAVQAPHSGDTLVFNTIVF